MYADEWEDFCENENSRQQDHMYDMITFFKGIEKKEKVYIAVIISVGCYYRYSQLFYLSFSIFL